VGSGARIRWVSRLRSGKFLSTLLGHGFGCARGLSFQQSGCLNIWFGMHTDGEGEKGSVRCVWIPFLPRASRTKNVQEAFVSLCWFAFASIAGCKVVGGFCMSKGVLLVFLGHWAFLTGCKSFWGGLAQAIIIQGVFMGGQSVRAMAWVAFAHALRSVQRGGGEQGIFDFGDTHICMGKASYC